MKRIHLLVVLSLFFFKGNSTTIFTRTNFQDTQIEISNNVDHSKWNSLLKKNVSNTGKVNYKEFIKDKPALENYLTYLSANEPSKSWSKNAILAYWINVYNAFTVKLIIDNYPTKSIKDINNPWGKKFFTIGTTKYSLEQVEHEILRKMGEPRIHFAINCASFSCPNLLNEAFTETKLEKQLSQVAKSFINDSSKNIITASKIEISQIFNWFGGDFKTNSSLIDFINKYSSIKIDAKAKTSFKDYNWSLNE